MKCAVIGSVGHWHIVRSAAEIDPSVEVVAVAPDRPEEDISNLINAFPGAKVCGNWQDAIEGCDFAIVNPWFCDAAKISAYCLGNGLHVYSEKPLATTFEDLALVENAWAASGKALGGMFNYRFFPWFMAMKAAVEAGEIGMLRQIHAQKSYRMGVRPDFYKSRDTFGGLIPWVAIHAIDWATAFGGDCKWVTASHSTIENRGNGDMECTSATLMGMENGVIATVTADFFRPTGSARHDDDRLRLTGTRGMVEAIDGKVYLENENAKRELPLPPMRNAFLEFAASIENGTADIFAKEALRATRIALSARESADNNGIRMEI